MVKIELGLKKTRSSALLADWISTKHALASTEKEAVNTLKESLFDNITAWNEDELKFKLLGPLMQIIAFDHEDFRAFTQRKLEAIIETTTKTQIRVSGVVDFVVAIGRVLPRQPFFFLA